MATPRRSLLVLVAGCALLAASTVAATADDPLADVAPAVLARAETVLQAVPDDRPPEVLVTSRTSPGARPEFTTVPVDGRVDALETIADALGADDTVGVEMMQTATIAATNDPLRKNQWALDLLKPETTAYPYSKGGQVKVAVVDTGVMIENADLEGRVTPGKDFVAPGTWARDENGHGTHVAGIIAAGTNNRTSIAGLAPWSTIVPVRVLDATGSGTAAAVAAGITWAADQGVAVINLSLEVKASDAVRAAVAYAIGRNVVVVAAAGNHPCRTTGNQTVYPAAYPGVIGVAALARAGGPASFSSCGSWVDVAAPGSQIMSIVPSRHRLSQCTPGRSSCLLSGTSEAAPHVAGAAALRIARTGRTRYDAATVSNQVLGATKDVGPAGRDDGTGRGLIDLRKLLTP